VFLAPVGFERIGNTAKIPRKETGPVEAHNSLIEDRLFAAVATWRGRAAWTASVAERAMNRCNGFRLSKPPWMVPWGDPFGRSSSPSAPAVDSRNH